MSVQFIILDILFIYFFAAYSEGICRLLLYVCAQYVTIYLNYIKYYILKYII